MKVFKTVTKLIIIGLLLHNGVGLAKTDKNLFSSSDGRIGGNRVYSADTFNQGALGIGFHGETYKDRESPFDTSSVYQANKIFFSCSPADFLQLYINNNYISISNPEIFGPLTSLSLGKLETGLTLAYPINHSISLGLEGLTSTIYGNKIATLKGLSWGFRGLTSFDLYRFHQKAFPLRLHLNTKFFYNNTDEAIKFPLFDQNQLIDIGTYNTLTYGAGLSFNSTYLSPYVEYTFDHTLKSSLSFLKENSQRLTSGLKIRLKRGTNLFLNLGADAAMVSSPHKTGIPLIPDYSIHCGLSFNSYQIEPEKKAVLVSVEPTKIETKETPTEEIKEIKAITDEQELAQIEEEIDRLLEEEAKVIQLQEKKRAAKKKKFKPQKMSQIETGLVAEEEEEAKKKNLLIKFR